MAKSFTLRISDPSGGTRVLPYDGMYLKYLKSGHCGAGFRPPGLLRGVSPSGSSTYDRSFQRKGLCLIRLDNQESSKKPQLSTVQVALSSTIFGHSQSVLPITQSFSFKPSFDDHDTKHTFELEQRSQELRQVPD